MKFSPYENDFPLGGGFRGSVRGVARGGRGNFNVPAASGFKPSYGTAGRGFSNRGTYRGNRGKLYRLLLYSFVYSYCKIELFYFFVCVCHTFVQIYL